MLVVEDFPILARTIGTGLRREGMAVDVVLDGDDALERLAVTRYDVVVLDRDLPGVHGDEVCRRSWPGAADPGADADRGQHRRGPGRRARPGRRRLPAQAVRLRRARGPRPGPRPALRGRAAARAGMRRPDPGPGPPRRVPGRAAAGAQPEGVRACWSACSPPAGRWSPAEELLERVWDEAADPFTTTVKTTVRRLRAKLGDPPVIHTERGGGYRIGEA